MRRSSNDEDNKRIIMDLDVVVKSHNCPYIIQCIGTFIFTVHNRNITTHSSRLTAIIRVNVCQTAVTVKSWRILLEQSFTASVPLLMTAVVIQIRKKVLQFSGMVLV